MNQYSDRPDPGEGANSTGRDCVLMFSGGRDSTLAALRLSRQQYRLLLLTVTSEHLSGIHSVIRRLNEFRLKFPTRATWLHVVQPSHLVPEMKTGHRTCLPCHAAYSGLGLRFALDNNMSNIAFGYTGYQSTWIEQTPQAIEILRRSLRAHGVDLLLPVSDLPSKADAIRELRLAGLTPDALEQKCLVQQLNNTLPSDELTTELHRWSQALEQVFRHGRYGDIHVVQRVTLGPMELPDD